MGWGVLTLIVTGLTVRPTITTKTQPIIHVSPARMTGPGQTSPAVSSMIQEWTNRSLGPAPPSQVTAPRYSSTQDVVLTAPLER